MKNASTGNTAADLTDWARVRNMSDTDITHDEDSPATTEADWDNAIIKRAGKPIGRVRGPQKAPTKTQITLRLSQEVLDYFRATGPGWQTRIDSALKDWLAKR